VHGCGRRGVALGEQRVRALRPELRVERIGPLAQPRRRRRRQVEVDERRAQVEPRPADDDRQPPGRERLVDRRVREPLVLADRELVPSSRIPTSRVGSSGCAVRISSPR
jgi:hypothetical protein